MITTSDLLAGFSLLTVVWGDAIFSFSKKSSTIIGLVHLWDHSIHDEKLFLDTVFLTSGLTTVRWNQKVSYRTTWNHKNRKEPNVLETSYYAPDYDCVFREADAAAAATKPAANAAHAAAAATARAANAAPAAASPTPVVPASPLVAATSNRRRGKKQENRSVVVFLKFQ